MANFFQQQQPFSLGQLLQGAGGPVGTGQVPMQQTFSGQIPPPSPLGQSTVGGVAPPFQAHAPSVLPQPPVYTEQVPLGVLPVRGEQAGNQSPPKINLSSAGGGGMASVGQEMKMPSFGEMFPKVSAPAASSGPQELSPYEKAMPWLQMAQALGGVKPLGTSLGDRLVGAAGTFAGAKQGQLDAAEAKQAAQKLNSMKMQLEQGKLNAEQVKAYADLQRNVINSFNARIYANKPTNMQQIAELYNQIKDYPVDVQAELLKTIQAASLALHPTLSMGYEGQPQAFNLGQFLGAPPTGAPATLP